jgi:hypothetical protein
MAKVAEACRLIDEAEEEPKLDELAQTIGLSPYHFHRIFKSIAGLTPKALRSPTGRSASATARNGHVGSDSFDPGLTNSGRGRVETGVSAERNGGKVVFNFAVARECLLNTVSNFNPSATTRTYRFASVPPFDIDWIRRFLGNLA